MKLTVVTFTAYGRVLKKYFWDNELLMRHVYMARIRKICSTALIHTVEHYETTFLSKKEYEPISKIDFKIIHEDI